MSRYSYAQQCPKSEQTFVVVTVVYVITASINLIRNSPIQIEISIRIVIKLLSLNLGCIIAGCHGIQLY